MSVLSVHEGKSLRVSRSVRDPVSASLLQLTRWERVNERMLSKRHNDSKRERAEENPHDAESGGSGANLVVSGGEAMPSLLVLRTLRHWGNECGTEPGKNVVDDDDKG